MERMPVMMRQTRISLYKLIVALSDALDYVCPEITDHQQRVTYIAVNLARQIGYAGNDLADLFVASALHDIGMIRLDQKKSALVDGEWNRVRWHCKTGYELIHRSELFNRAARIIRHHHLPWERRNEVKGAEPFEILTSQIIHLADTAERAIDRDRSILSQSHDITRGIVERSGADFSPEIVKAFETLAGTEAFWLDCDSKRIDGLLLESVDETFFSANNKVIEGIAEIFARVVDSMSAWTATHSAGVAATAVALAKLMRFSPHEQALMRTAGLLHDLGKLSVPNRILDKKGKLTGQEWVAVKGHTYHTYRILDAGGFPREITEWAAFHHERLNGKGYPFHIAGKYLSLGARIMAIADMYTAMTEDRPYREGMDPADALSIMYREARSGGLDGELIAVMAEHIDYVDSMRKHDQSWYALCQERLAKIIEESQDEEYANPVSAGTDPEHA